MDSSSKVVIYAELLSNIRQVSVSCSLATIESAETTATLSSDGLGLTVQHGEFVQEICLPGRVAGRAEMPMPAGGTTKISWRFPLLRPSYSPSSDRPRVPWSSGDIQPGSSVRCRACKATVIEEHIIGVWRDLPSENWAEMMEFWHCHKPHEHQNEDGHELTSRGYGASSKIGAKSRVGFVDLTSFLFVQEDCTSLLIDRSTSIDTTDGTGTAGPGSASFDKLPAVCARCGVELGLGNSSTADVSLFKWQVDVDQLAGSTVLPEPTLSHCVSAMLSAMLDRSGSSKTVLLPVETAPFLPSDQSLLHLWLFNGDIRFSSTEAERCPLSAAKVLFREVSQKEADDMLESATSNVQEITLPKSAIREIAALLEKSTTYLPQGDRYFNEWRIGLLEKWTTDVDDDNGRGSAWS